ncbi:4'-phosphopantetheinyl transferase superfamily protein, partial [candidate division KSB1 bacterium]|nr:4'-phosphopantetheinyl transferase superfamily protein [candidate division KSB1 bacterium]NIR70788.1 4'-phosphopantetheinyl transferase superfamily protein [candidate division KSB1 bacterium]NIS24610.1 4'-phosphopantetheinyl transferase superfamily protein [candidate division KSB1 bacterium]NIT71519.1 4'-phosphopantetheinyl transferase superfamily protein [candidate division KSB1 bacterium]NIU25210.1 4'-phosphopantetheinyl transferase superfamily protein [candidate division KSB1 bacterium]
GMWAQVQEKYIFPIGIQKLELYGDTPPVGTRLPTYLEITEVTSKTMQANIEVQDGAGNVWMRIQGWKDWIFYWWPRLFAFTRKPTVNVLSQTMSLSNLANGCVCHTVDNENLRDFEINALARYFLHHDEMPSFHKLAEHPKRQREWLLGRIAAKDAVRVWLKEENTEEMLHPAEFIIENDDRGQPVVRNPGSDNSVPKISIAHSHGRALAVASAKSIGVDLEYISEKDTTFVEAITSSRERDWLTNVPSQEKAAWVTRLWCAKEAVSKMNGTGLNGKPKAFEAITFERSGDMTIQATENGQTTKVHTYQEENFIIALTSNPNS